MPSCTRRIPAFAAGLLCMAHVVVAADTAVEALQLYRAGKCSQAEPLLREILAQSPKDIPARKLLASCLVQLHRPG